MEKLFLQILLPFACSLTLMYAVYWAALRHSACFRINRFYLLGGMAFSLLLPFIKVYYAVPALDVETTEYSGMWQAAQGVQDSAGHVNAFINYMYWIFYTYLAGVAVCVLRTLVSAARACILRMKYGLTAHDGYRVVYMQNKLSHFSFFNLIFINRNALHEDEEQAVLNHERVHVSQGHSWDLLLLELVFAMQWFNPVVWAYKRAVKMTHEYLADHAAADIYADRGDYLKVLFAQASGFSFDGLISNFNYSPIKKRIIMLTNKTKQHSQKVRVLWAVPAMMVLFFCFSFKAKEMTPTTMHGEEELFLEIPKIAPSQDTVKKKNTSVAPEEEVIPAGLVEVKPIFQGGNENDFSNWVKTNFQYPEDAKKKGIQGRVFVQFIVNTTGQVTDMKIVRSIDKSIDKEIMRVFAMSPRWEAGKQKGKLVAVKYTLPINLTLTGGKADAKDTSVMRVEIRQNYTLSKTSSGTVAVEKEIISSALVEVKPTFQGGNEDDFSNWVKTNFQYPPDAMKKGIQGRVFVQFVVSTSGQVTDVKIVRSIDPSIDKELLRVFAMTPKWTPGVQKGKAVNVKYTMPINLTLK